MHSSIYKQIEVLATGQQSSQARDNAKAEGTKVSMDQILANEVATSKLISLVEGSESIFPSTSNKTPIYILKTVQKTLDQVSSDNAVPDIATTSTMELNSNSKSVKCFLCSENFETVSDMQSHYFDKHKLKKNVKLSTSQNNKVVMKKFLTNSVPEEEDLKCSVCSIAFKTIQEVDVHMAEVHSYLCSECQIVFYNLFQFTSHKCRMTWNPTKKRNKRYTIIRPTFNKVSKSTENLYTLNYSKSTNPVLIQGNSIGQLGKPELIQFNSAIHQLQQSNKSTPYRMPMINTTSKMQNLLNEPGKTCSKLKTASTGNGNLSVYTKDPLYHKLEEISSDALLKQKMDEIEQNPYISFEVIPQKTEHDSQEFLCGRCDVLCENHLDFARHIEECLLSSNVSMAPSTNCPKKLKLKCERVQYNRPMQDYKISQSLIDKLEDHKKENDPLSLIEWGSEFENKNCFGVTDIVSSINTPEVSLERLSQTPNLITPSKDGPMVVIPCNNIFKNPSMNGSTPYNAENFPAATIKNTQHPLIQNSLDHQNLSCESNLYSQPVLVSQPLAPDSPEMHDTPVEEPFLLRDPKTEPYDDTLHPLEGTEEELGPSYDLITEEDIKMEVEDEIVCDAY